MPKLITAATVSVLLSAPMAFADGHAGSGDPVAGEKAFSKCQTCHVVRDDEGTTLAGRSAKTGPNLYGIIGRQAGSVEGYRYGKSIVKAGEEGLIWDEETFVAYVQDPTGWLRERLGDSKARGKMSFKVRSDEDAVNLYAFLVSIGPEGGS